MDDSKMLKTISKNDRTFLAYNLQMPGGAMAMNLIKRKTDAKHFIIKDGSATEWRSNSTADIEGQFYILGPELQAVTLLDKVAKAKTADLPSLILNLSKALDTYKSKNKGNFRFLPEGILCLEDGGFLFISPDLLDESMKVLPVEDQIRTSFRYNISGLDAEQNYTFGIMSFLYQTLASMPAFDGLTLPEIASSIRARKIVPLNLLAPEVNDQVTEAISSALLQDPARLPGIAHVAQQAEAWMAMGMAQNLSAEEITTRKEKGQALIKQQASQKGIANFLSKNKFILLGIAAFLAVAGLIVYSMVENASITRKTRGLNEPQLITTFFDAVTAADVELMKDCLWDNAFADLLSLAKARNLQTKVQQGAGMPITLVNVKEWDKNGRPPLKANSVLFGVRELTIGASKIDENGKVFYVTYELWDTRMIEGKPVVEAKSILVDLYLKIDRRDWVIYRINDRTTTPVDTSMVVFEQ